MADSGNIFATDSPLPVQNANTPPSAYIRPTADAVILKADCRAAVGTPPSSGGRVIKKTFSRSKGAVHVLDTGRQGIGAAMKGEINGKLTCSSNPAGKEELESSVPFKYLLILDLVVLIELIFLLIPVICSCVLRKKEVGMLRTTLRQMWWWWFILRAQTHIPCQANLVNTPNGS